MVTFAVLNLFIGIIVDAMNTNAQAEAERVIEVTEGEYHHLLSEIRSLRSEVRQMQSSDENSSA